MKHKYTSTIALALVLALIVAGCSSTPPTPTKAPPTPGVTVIVVTATPPPATPTSPATNTPIPTVAATATAAGTPGRLTTTPGAPRATSTRRPPTATVPAATATLANKYAAPRLVGPVYDPGGRKDQAQVGSDIVFEWYSVGPLGQGECYLFRVDINPGGGDSFLQCNAQMATGLGIAKIAKFILFRPGFSGPNYGGLLSPNSVGGTVSWYVQVVHDDGSATTGANLDGNRHKFTPLGPKSTTAQFPLF